MKHSAYAQSHPADATGNDRQPAPPATEGMTRDRVREPEATLPATGQAAASLLPTVLLWLEFVALFLLVPTLYWRGYMPIGVIPGLFLFAALCTALLLLDRTFDRALFWNGRNLLAKLRWPLIRFAVFGGMLTAAVLLVLPDRFLAFPRGNPGVYAMVMCLYPIFSVFPQELIFRVFLFHRYRTILPRAWMRIAASAVTFAYIHLAFPADPVVSLVLSLLGGVLFAWTYEKTRSAAAVVIEHALYGDLVWTIGLGTYFYRGAVGG